MSPKPKLPPVRLYNLINEGIDGPLAYGFHRALKHSGPDISDAEIDRICDQQHDALMTWFCETFDFGDE